MGGLIVGPLFLIPISSFIGSTSVIFWSLILTVALNIWSAEANGSDDLISFAVARGLAGLFGQIPLTLAPGFIVNTFFLHQRGKAFAVSSTLFTLATVMGPSFDGFIVQVLPWPESFWWLVAGNAAAALLVFVFMEETAFDRRHFERRGDDVAPPERTWLGDRIATFLPGHRATPDTGSNLANMVQSAYTSLLIAVSPATVLAGLFTMIDFAWNVALPIELSIFLQMPWSPAEGDFGYGYNARQTGLFYIALWLGMLCGQLYGLVVNDRIPLFLWRRTKAATVGNVAPWLPEYRLHTAWLPGLVFLPVGLGLVGASLEHHYHFMVLALGSFLTTCGGPSAVSISVNYAVETFKKHPQEVGAVMNVYRLALGLATPFIFDSWTAAVGIGWVWGMMGLLSLVVFLVAMAPLMLFGPALRNLSFVKSTDVQGDKSAEDVFPTVMGH